jgi:hypothetical protein
MRTLMQAFEEAELAKLKEEKPGLDSASVQRHDLEAVEEISRQSTEPGTSLNPVFTVTSLDLHLLKVLTAISQTRARLKSRTTRIGPARA